MPLELHSLRRSVDVLGRSVALAGSAEKMAALDADVREAVRSGVIQNFEVAYELCWKFMKRWLEVNVGSAEVDGVTRRELFRVATENRLITDVDLWMEFHESRNESSHIYDEQTAENVFGDAKRFLVEAKSLIAVLEARND
ncbi:MAG: HI0074 family nucleotidyltransferase substrate-binding subunit [Myxococcota bacterium]|jgi:nucleotidyltransferase substrate binding protein (TIGR01987 family)